VASRPRPARGMRRRCWPRPARSSCAAGAGRKTPLDEDGAPVDPSNPAARRWSVAGALLAVWEEWRGAGKPADLVSRDFAEAGLALRAAVGDIVAWNDAPERTHGEVLAAFDRAIELLRATAAWGSEPRSIRTVDPSGREGR